MLLGVDGSNNNGLPASFKPMKRAGYSFALWKVSEGAYFTDHTWPGARQGLAKAGIPHGGYHYAIAKNANAGAQAAYFLERLKAAPWLLLPMLDVEEQGSEGVAPHALETFCLTWGRVVASALRVDRLILYANGDMLWNRGLDTPAMRELFLLDYAYPSPHEPRLPAGWRTVMWQFDWHGAVPGFAGAVDRDYLLAPHTLAELTIHAHQPKPSAARPARHTGAVSWASSSDATTA